MNKIKQLTGAIGRRTIRSSIYLLDLCAFAYRILIQILTHPTVGRRLVSKVVIEQIYYTAVQALPIIIPAALIIGTMLIFRFDMLEGQFDFGKTVVFLVVREIGPMITALLVILRSATAITVEISYMQTFHEIDALEMAGLDPLRIVCIPRLVGITTAILFLFVVFDIVAIVGGYTVVWLTTYISMEGFFSQIGKAITISDILVGIIKAMFFGIIITIICLYRGFEKKKLITQIPVATSKAAVECFFYCLIVNLFISALFIMT